MVEYQKLLEFLRPFTEGLEGYMGLTRANRSQEPQDNKKWGEFHNIYCEVNDGEINLPEEALLDSPEWEWYFTPGVLSEASRLQSKFKASRLIWIDFDEPVEWQTFEPAPSIVVQTSENKHHCYWLLQEPITDVNDMRYWCKRFLEFFSGGDESGFDATQLLKLPWGLNLKLGARNEDGTPFAPKVVKFNTGLRYSETDFSHIPEPSVNLPDTVDLSDISDVPEVSKPWITYATEYGVPAELITKLAQTQDGGEEKRSGALYNLTCEVFDVVESSEKIFQILYTSPNDKFTADHGRGRGATLLWKDINRVVAKKEQAKVNQGPIEAIAEILNGKASYREKGVQVSAYVMDALEATGKFIQNDQGQYFYSDLRTGAARLTYVSVKNTSNFAGMVGRRFGINAGVDKNILSGVLHDVIRQCQMAEPITFHHFAHYDIMSNRVYVDRYNGSMYVLDGESVTAHHYGYDDVYFYPNEQNQFPKPFNYTTGYEPHGLETLVLDGPNYTTQAHRISRKELMHLLKTWVASFFFPTAMDTKPIILIHGAADSGKTTLFQNLSVMFTGDSTYSVTEIPKDSKEFNLQATRSSYIFYDNVEVNKKEIQEKLAQVATGYTVKTRKLYEDNVMISTKARAFVGITTRTLDRIQDDVAQRYVIVPVHPFSANKGNKRRAMSSILKDVMDKRDDLWSELLDFVNKMVKQIDRHGLQQTGTKMRMADYGAFLDLTCSMVGLSPSKLEDFILGMQAQVVNENEPIFVALVKLVDSGYAEDHRYTPKELHDALCRAYSKVRSNYATPAKFSRSLNAFIDNGQLLRTGIKVESLKSGNNRLFRITDMRGEAEDSEEE